MSLILREHSLDFVHSYGGSSWLGKGQIKNSSIVIAMAATSPEVVVQYWQHTTDNLIWPCKIF